MSDNLGNIVFDGKNVDLNLASKEELKEILTEIAEDEMLIKQDLDRIIMDIKES